MDASLAAPDARARAGQVALPELDGALEPIVFAGRDSNTGKSHSLPDRIDTLCSRAINWAKCAARPWSISAAVHACGVIFYGITQPLSCCTP